MVLFVPVLLSFVLLTLTSSLLMTLTCVMHIGQVILNQNHTKSNYQNLIIVDAICVVNAAQYAGRVKMIHGAQTRLVLNAGSRNDHGLANLILNCICDTIDLCFVRNRCYPKCYQLSAMRNSFALPVSKSNASCLGCLLI